MKKELGSRLLFHKKSAFPYAKEVQAVNAWNFQHHTDPQLKEELEALRQSGMTQQKEVVRAFALLKEIIDRITGLLLFDTQLATAFSLQYGRLAQLPTGEGKTLAAVLPAVVHAMQGKSVHILVFNDYLAKRDYALTREIYQFCGLSPSYLCQTFSLDERKAAYQGNPVYLCAKEAGFDLLRNFLCRSQAELLLTKRDYAIIDEADSILIDEARIPLVIAGNSPDSLYSPMEICRTVEQLDAENVTVNRSEQQVFLTDSGIQRVEALLHIDNLYDEKNLDLLSLVHAALQAKYLLVRDRDYLVKNGKIQIIDEMTGRISENRKYPDILHSAVEAREGLCQEANSLIYNSMSIQNYLCQYRKLSGMTGTIETSREEMETSYGLQVDVIPPHLPCIRQDHEDLLYHSREEKFFAIVQEIIRIHQKGQPVLIGTQSVKESEELSAMLHKERIPHCVLNARNDEQEAELIARAGQACQVTVSTNMAGRGVDIKLGGVEEKEKQRVLESGGLYIIGTGLNRSIRIDNQLRGRAGRQGDAGESRFFVSLEDEIPTKYHLERNVPQPACYAAPITLPRLHKAIRKAQKNMEGEDAESRYMLKKYAFILEQQRQLITKIRDGYLMETEPVCYLQEAEPDTLEKLCLQVGSDGVQKAQRQLALYYINLRWAQYLESMEYVRDGIHFTVVGGKNPIDEYHRVAIASFEDMLQDIKNDVVHGMKKYHITQDGIDMEQAGLSGATTTWTYQIDDSQSQFNSMRALGQRLYQSVTDKLASFSDQRHQE